MIKDGSKEAESAVPAGPWRDIIIGERYSSTCELEFAETVSQNRT